VPRQSASLEVDIDFLCINIERIDRITHDLDALVITKRFPDGRKSMAVLSFDAMNDALEVFAGAVNWPSAPSRTAMSTQ
jgi:hypothetical protein